MTVKILGKTEEVPKETCAFSEALLPAGFPSQADDHLERPLDLHELLVKHPAATFFVRVEGDSMVDAGIGSGDLLVVDRALPPQDGRIIVALIDGEFTVKRLKREKEKIWLLPENPAYKPIRVDEASDFQVWGIVTYVISRAS